MTDIPEWANWCVVVRQNGKSDVQEFEFAEDVRDALSGGMVVLKPQTVRHAMWHISKLEPEQFHAIGIPDGTVMVARLK